MRLSLQDVAPWLDAAAPVGQTTSAITRIHTDTRTLAPGDLFVAIAGENFDANSMLAQAKASGAIAAVAHARASDGLAASGLPGFEVPDTRAALAQLALGWRKRYQGCMVAVTGSNGKTTVTQMLASIFRAHAGDAAHATQNSFNNDIGVPLTLLALRSHHTHAVLEIGMNHPGEIAALAQLVRPQVALVNNAQREHLEFMKTVEAVAAENASVFDFVAHGGTAVFPSDDAFTTQWAEHAASRGLRGLRFGAGGDVTCAHRAEPWGHALQLHTPQGDASVDLRVPGLHNALNALAATSCALAAGLPLSAVLRGLNTFAPVKGRSNLRVLQGRLLGVALVDDSYNANPDSVKAAIAMLKSLPGPQLLVLGDMGEVGDEGPQFHQEVGRLAAQSGIASLLSFGSQSRHAHDAYLNASGRNAFHESSDWTLFEQAVLVQCTHAKSILVKGSRFMRMERAVQALVSFDESPTAKKENHAA